MIWLTSIGLFPLVLRAISILSSPFAYAAFITYLNERTPSYIPLNSTSFWYSAIGQERSIYEGLGILAICAIASVLRRTALFSAPSVSTNPRFVPYVVLLDL